MIREIAESIAFGARVTAAAVLRIVRDACEDAAERIAPDVVDGCPACMDEAPDAAAVPPAPARADRLDASTPN